MLVLLGGCVELRGGQNWNQVIGLTESGLWHHRVGSELHREDIPPNSTLSTESDPRSHEGDSQPIRRVLQQGNPHAEQDPKLEH